MASFNLAIRALYLASLFVALNLYLITFSTLSLCSKVSASPSLLPFMLLDPSMCICHGSDSCWPCNIINSFLALIKGLGVKSAIKLAITWDFIVVQVDN